MSFKPGDTFSYGGTVPGLDRAIPWGAAASLKSALTGAAIDDLTVTLTKASDWATSGNWNIVLYAAAADTALWAVGQASALICDIRFFNTASADPVLHSETFTIRLAQKVTA